MTSIELGATLYVPALNPRAVALARGANPDLRSMVLCLEDAIREDQASVALRMLSLVLQQLLVNGPKLHLYIRPRDIRMLRLILQMPGIETVEGFVLPKVTTETLPQWLVTLAQSQHRFMPTIEGEEAFCLSALARVCDQLRSSIDRVTAVRIGGNDILGLLGLRRSRVRTAYDGLLGKVIRDIAGTFIPNGFQVAAPVFEHYSEIEVLRQEVEQDVEHGLLTKTAIHPSQVKTVQDLYRPSVAEFTDARNILDHAAPGVFGASGSMCEPATHSGWAESVLRRASTYGVASEYLLATAVA